MLKRNLYMAFELKLKGFVIFLFCGIKQSAEKQSFNVAGLRTQSPAGFNSSHPISNCFTPGMLAE